MRIRSLEVPSTAAEALRFELVVDPEEATKLVGEWDALADDVGAGPHARPAYALAWWRHLGKGRLLLALVRERGRIVALAPLHQRRVGPIAVVRWLGHGLGCVGEALVRPGHENAAHLLWSSLATPGRVIELVEARAGGGGLGELVALELPGRRTTVTPRDRCPVAELGPDPDGLALVQRREARNLRNALKKADNALAKAGLEFRVEVATDPSSFDAMLPEIRSVMDAAEDHQPRQHLLRPPYEGFVLEHIRAELSAGRAVVLGGFLDERLVTFRFALLSSSTMWLSLSRFDPQVARFAPGHLMYRETFRWAAEHGLSRVDLLLGENQTKRQWSTGAYDTLDVVNGSSGALAVVSGAERLAAMIKGAVRGGAGRAGAAALDH